MSNRKTVLIVEDDKTSMKLFTDLLQNYYIVVQSVDGSDIMELIEECHPDLILMDIKLPHVSGLTHTKTLKANDNLKHIPIIAVTAFAMKGDEQIMLDAGCDDYIAKPISIPKFLDMIDKHINP